MFRKSLLCSVALVVCTTSAIAQEELNFKKVQRNRNIVFRGCELFDDVQSVTIRNGGESILLSKNMKRGAYRLRNKFNYFACGLDSKQQTRIFVKKRLSQKATALRLSLKRFPKGGINSCSSFRASTDGPMGWLHKPVSDSTRSIVNLFPSSDRPTSCRYERSNGSLITNGYSSGIHNGFRTHIRPQGGGSCSRFPANMVLNCSIGGRRVCYRIPNPCQRYD